MRQHVRHRAPEVAVKQRDDCEAGKDGVRYSPRRLQQRRNEQEAHNQVRLRRKPRPRDEFVEEYDEVQRARYAYRAENEVIERYAACFGLFGRCGVKQEDERQREGKMDGSLFLREQKAEPRSVEVEAGHRHSNEGDQLSLPARQNPEARFRVVLAHKLFEVELGLFVGLLNLSCVFHFSVTHDYSSFCRACVALLTHLMLCPPFYLA